MVPAVFPPLSNASAQLWLPPACLTSCIRGVMTRDTMAVELEPLQRFNHYPATPLCTVSWYFQGEIEMLAPGAPARLDSPRSPVPARIAFGGPYTHPSVSWNPGPAHGMMLLVLPDAVHHLTGIHPRNWMNRMVDVAEVLPDDWLRMCRAVAVHQADCQRVQIIEAFLRPRWQAARPKGPLGLNRYTDWATEMALRAAATKTGRSLRQIERRILQWAGRPMRELRGFGRAEQAFFQMMAAEDTERQPWSALAEDAGYSDQSHLCRVSRRITGCTPSELWDRIARDEGFWPYRIWQ
jgi:AraC-like DNA-binding protein